MITIKSERELELMRRAGRVVAEVLREMEKAVRPGITTLELDRIAERHIRRANCTPAFKGYHGFPASICASVNEEVVHGIPSLRRLQDGDIISIDVGTVYQGYYGDAAATFPVGDVAPEALDLIRVTKESLRLGIAQAVEGNHLTDISHAVQTYVEENGFAVVRNYVGHGIGNQMHEEPQVPNFGKPGRGPRLQAGMALAIEPMVNTGTWQVETLQDNWTVVTLDRKWSAHFEHTVAIGKVPEILTALGDS
ncbi:type I methionyl aminopeptidase [Dethiobacter alkaliphilus]|uniref:type I methionyl aminopeptidase n=1 Tax=Dethiobacter alkaliphilus TaxID=427926 RepID=UPI002225B7E2|nr:type I methionyl aminopeptidase [Dethiobacter alkaliphilus]MCW3491104.1 type I methionyl aminopeptidase [Dethiobacter alkaliphilus]